MGSLVLVGAVAASGGWFLTTLHRSTRRWAERMAIAAVLLTAGAVALLTIALVEVDPSLRYVARHSSSDTPFQYRVAGVWGGMEGSLLIWALMATIAGLAAVRTARSSAADLEATTSTVAAACATFFLVLVLVADPFETLRAPTGIGDGLTAVLQHPAMIYHPPLLYTGLVLLVVPFVLTAAALHHDQLSAAWVAAVTPWLHASWAILAAGLLTGSRWAYVELGWGGFWAWDPVENAGLLPWLITVSAIHHLRSAGSARVLAALIGAAFVAMIAGVYLTRAGTSGSIHAFASSPSIGRALAVFSVAVIVLLGTTLWRVLPSDSSHPFGTDRGLHVQVAGGLLVATTVLVGTFGPTVREFVDGQSTIVTPRYYERALGPIVLVLLVAMAIIGTTRTRATRSEWAAAAIATVLVGVLAVIGIQSAAPLAFAVIACATVGFGASLLLRRRSAAAALSHAGLALMIAGAVAASTGSTDELSLTVGRADPTVGDAELLSLEPGEADQYTFVRALVVVHGQPYEPELRAYRSERIPVSESALRARPLQDTIVSLEFIDPDLEGARVIIRKRPLAGAVWTGALLIVAGGLLAWRASRRATVEGSYAAATQQGARAAPQRGGGSTAGGEPSHPDRAPQGRGSPPG